MSRTGLGTGSAGRTLLLVYYGQPSLAVHADGTKLAGGNTIAAAQTSETAVSLAGTGSVDSLTSTHAIIHNSTWTMLTTAVASHYGHHRVGIGYCHTEQVSNLPHDGRTANGTCQTVDAAKVGTLDKRIGHTAAASKAATATVGTRQDFKNLTDTRVFFHSKLLGNSIEHHRCNEGYGSQYDNCNQNKIHNINNICFRF